MTDDILDTLKCGRPEYNEETRNYETIITKNERLAIKEITRLREENARLREALKDLIEEDEYQTCSGEEDDSIARATARAAIREGGNG